MDQATVGHRPFSSRLTKILRQTRTRWITGAMQTVRYNGYPAMRITGEPAPGQSSGAAIAEMERIAAQLPEGFGFEWTGQSREEKLAGAQALIRQHLSRTLARVDEIRARHPNFLK